MSPSPLLTAVIPIVRLLTEERSQENDDYDHQLEIILQEIRYHCHL